MQISSYTIALGKKRYIQQMAYAYTYSRIRLFVYAVKTNITFT